MNVAVTYATLPEWSVAAITIAPGGVEDGIVTGTLNDVALVLARIGPVVPRLMSTDPPGGGAKPPPATMMVAPGGPLVGLSAIEVKTPHAPAESVVAASAPDTAIKIGIPRIHRVVRPPTTTGALLAIGVLPPHSDAAPVDGSVVSSI